MDTLGMIRKGNLCAPLSSSLQYVSSLETNILKAGQIHAVVETRGTAGEFRKESGVITEARAVCIS